jgi:AcrR family transcriptional regulator
MLDPPILQTRRLLQETLEKLLQTRNFAEISVDELLNAAQIDRATFSEHYDNVTALLECLVAFRIGGLLEKHRVRFDCSNPEALRGVALSVCDYMATLPEGRTHGPDPHLENALIEVIRWVVLEGIAAHLPLNGTPAGMVASAAAWGIYGVAKEWRFSSAQRSPQKTAEIIARMVSPMLEPARPHPQEIESPAVLASAPESPTPEPEKPVQPRLRSWAS